MMTVFNLTCNIGHNPSALSLFWDSAIILILSKGIYQAFKVTYYIFTVDLNILSWYNFALWSGHRSLKHLSVKGNRYDPSRNNKLAEMLTVNKTLTDLNLSSCGLGGKAKKVLQCWQLPFFCSICVLFDVSSAWYNCIKFFSGSLTWF